VRAGIPGVTSACHGAAAANAARYSPLLGRTKEGRLPVRVASTRGNSETYLLGRLKRDHTQLALMLAGQSLSLAFESIALCGKFRVSASSPASRLSSPGHFSSVSRVGRSGMAASGREAPNGH
jgi:hypothetical protein